MGALSLDLGTVILLEKVYPELRQRILRAYQDIYDTTGYKMRATRGLSSMEEQLVIWNKGRDSEGNIINASEVVTHARPGSSWHNYGLAVDSCFQGQDPYWEYLQHRDPGAFAKRWGAFGYCVKSNGLEWGGDFVTLIDRPHVQARSGLTMPLVQELFKRGGINAVFDHCDEVK